MVVGTEGTGATCPSSPPQEVARSKTAQTALRNHEMADRRRAGDTRGQRTTESARCRKGRRRDRVADRRPVRPAVLELSVGHHFLQHRRALSHRKVASAITKVDMLAFVCLVLTSAGGGEGPLGRRGARWRQDTGMRTIRASRIKPEGNGCRCWPGVGYPQSCVETGRRQGLESCSLTSAGRPVDGYQLRSRSRRPCGPAACGGRVCWPWGLAAASARPTRFLGLGPGNGAPSAQPSHTLTEAGEIRWKAECDGRDGRCRRRPLRSVSGRQLRLRGSRGTARVLSARPASGGVADVVAALARIGRGAE